MKTKLRITKFVMFCITAYILIPKLADYTGAFSTASAKSLSTNSSEVNSQGLKNKNVYIPPNYGGPDSLYGSGTR
jgi:hypothetical protein